MANKASPPVPAGCEWCHGCQAALPLGRFSKRSSRGRTVLQSRCRPCLAKQKQEQRVACRQRYASWTVRYVPRKERVRLPEEVDCVSLSLR